MVLVPKVNSNECSKAYSPMYNITSTMLCAGVPEGGKDACQVSTFASFVSEELEEKLIPCLD